MAYDLNKPLGLDRPARKERRPFAPIRTFGWGALVLAVAAGSLAVTLRGPGYERAASLPAPAPSPAPAAAEIEPVPAAARPNIIRGHEGGISIVESAPFPVDPAYTGSIRVHEPGSLRQPARLAHLPDDTLLEPSAFGPLPRRAADGRRPLDVYAGTTNGGRGARIALIVGGLGISQTGTQVALATLPPGVTLGFAAAGNSLDRWMQEARRGGHELLLQAPMEPFGYPNVSPGPGTLTVAEAQGGELENLHRAMARMTNYVGVMNFMGARLSAEAGAMEPVLAEIERRGLLYVDDGSSPRSAARDVAMANHVPFARAERQLDQIRDRDAIRAELDILERSARAQGSAIGVASAFDVSVAAIAEWVREAGERGVEIVPVSALAHDPEAR